MKHTLRDEFLSEEDLDLRTMSHEELLAYWDQWLLQAQTTNPHDRRTYSHGVFVMIDEPEKGGNDTADRPAARTPQSRSASRSGLRSARVAAASVAVAPTAR